MDRQRRSRYVLAVYLVVLSLAMILVLAGLFFTTNPDWKAVWINLGTGLLGVVVLFFLVQRFFLARSTVSSSSATVSPVHFGPHGWYPLAGQRWYTSV